MISRRIFIQVGAIGVALGRPGICGARDRKGQPLALPAGIGVQPDFDGPLPAGDLGKQPALAAETKIAREILAGAPTACTPYEVAQYFVAVDRGDFGKEWRAFTSGWPVRWNPVLVAFFTATNTEPEGDTTPWCAAFMNWCFLQGTSKSATQHASSGSFRCFGSDAAAQPKEGDVVVFRQPESHEPCGGKGHVGFFVKDHGETVEVLGGNQIDGHDKSHRISIKRFKKDGELLKLHSIRSADAQQQARWGA